MTRISQCMFLHFTMHLLPFFCFQPRKLRIFPDKFFLPATNDDLHFMDVFGEPKSDYRSFWQNIYADFCRLGYLHNLMNFAGAGGGKCGFQVRLMHLTLIVQSISESFLIGCAKVCRRFSVWRWYHCQFHPSQELNIREFPLDSVSNRRIPGNCAGTVTAATCFLYKIYYLGALAVHAALGSRWLPQTFTHCENISMPIFLTCAQVCSTYRCDFNP